MHYHVEWTTEVEANSPEEAAQIARSQQPTAVLVTDEDSLAPRRVAV